MIQPTVQPYNLFRPQDLEHQGNVRQAQPPHTPGQQLVSQPARQDAQMAQQAEARARQTVYNTPAQPVQTVSQPASSPIQQKPVTSTDELAAALGYTSPQEEERLRKASVMNQRIMAFGDAIRHIGNIANTVNYAPSQQFNNPVAEEEARYQRGKALRDKANLTYYNYMMQKAKQDAQQRQWDRQYQLSAANAASQAAYRQNQARIAAERAANQKAYQESNLAFNKDKWKQQSDLNERKFKQQTKHQNIMAGIASRNASTNASRLEWQKTRGGNGGSGVAPLDTPKGRITPNGKSYSNQLLQMFDYAKSKGYVQESDVAKRLRELGFGNDQSDNVKRQMVMDLLRTNQDMGDYASSRLGWSYGAGVGGDMDLGLEDDEDEMDLGLD